MELKAANASIDEANFAKRNEEITLSMAEYVRYVSEYCAEYVRYVSEYCAKKLQMAENNYAEL